MVELLPPQVFQQVEEEVVEPQQLDLMLQILLLVEQVEQAHQMQL
tara:strand:+ start:280 stop:414 length:135 start_codon:yes stop_codon:yes gene_type:complete